MEEENQGQPTPENESTPAEETNGERTFTQKDVDKIAGQRAKEAKKAAQEAAQREILEKAGAESIDELIAGHQSFKTIEEETATEADKERKAREKAETERDEAKQVAADALKLADERTKKAELKVALIDAGARKDKLSKLLREADLSPVEVDGDEVKGIDSVVAKLQADEADWFGSSHQSLPNTPTGSNHQAKDSAYKPRYNIPGAS